MNRAASSSLTDVELVLFLVDGTMWTADDEMVLNKLAKSGLPTVLLINKVDNVKDKHELFPHLQNCRVRWNLSTWCRYRPNTAQTSKR
jgi:GTP-binding protein Era